MAFQPGYQARPTFASPPPVGLPQFAGAPPVAPSAVPSGTLAPGTIVNVGAYTVRVDRFLSEGGFAHVYLATSETPIPAGSPTATTKHVLKRMAVPNKAGVEEVGKEVEVMRLLKNHPKIVNFIEASVSELSGAGGTSKGYEIYILMEWCPGGGIIDMMNTRLQNRLTESEILKVFSDTVEAVAHMHYQNPPLIHRDLKVENILLSPPNTFKLCDFGSTTIPLARVPTAVNEIQALEADINRTTTLQYRAPELVDVWSRKGYDEKIDIWALGVFLYKLCYYTTPFEEHGPLAILNAQYKIPPYPAYSNAIKGLIGGMLQERASQRPNIYQVHEQVCRLRGTSVKIDNKYASKASSASRPGSQASAKPASAYSSVISSNPLPSVPSGPSLAETISPMRRGRPSKGATATPEVPLPPMDNRMVRTGLASVGGDKPWDAMAGPGWPSDGTSTSAPISAAPTAAGAGFGDTFASAPAFGETFKSHTPSPPRSPAPPSPRPGTAAAAGLFSDLVAPPKQPVPSNGANSGTPALSFEEWKLARKASSPALAADPKLDREPSFSPNYDLLNLSSKTTSTPSLASAPLPSLSPRPAQLTDGSANDEVAPPLPRRPPRNATQPQVVSPLPRQPSKPELISRASQTSPHLMASWKPPASQPLKQSSAPPATQPYQQSSPASRGSSPAPTFRRDANPAPAPRKPMIDLLGDDDDDDLPASSQPQVPATTGPPSLPPKTLPQTTSAASKRMSLGGELPRAQFRPTRSSDAASLPPPTIGVKGKSPSGFTSSFASAAPLKAAADPLEAKDRFPSLDDFDTPAVRTDVQREDSWQAIVEKEDDSSDDEPGRFAPKRPATGQRQATLPPATKPKPFMPAPTPAPPPILASPDQQARDFANLPPIRRPPSSEDEGDIDLGPALSSIRKFAPSGNNNAPKLAPPAEDDDDFAAPPVRSSYEPVLQAPTPQTAKRQAAISSLVSRYETLSNEPPAPPSKPASLRRAGSVSSTTSSSTSHRRAPSANWISPKADVDGFQHRFPDSEGLDTHFAASATPPAPKPKPAPLSPTRSLTVSSAPSQRLPFKPVPPASSSPAAASARPLPLKPDADDEEEKFVGVSNMRSRWEGIGRGGPAGPATGPGKPAVRKEWGVV